MNFLIINDHNNCIVTASLGHGKKIIHVLPVVVHRSSETSINQSDVIIRSDDRFLNLVVDSDSICLTLFFGCFFLFLCLHTDKNIAVLSQLVFFALILTNIWQFCPSVLLTLSQYTYLD